MQNYYLTFGVKYNHEVHPCWSIATGGGWVRIEALSYDEARLIARQFFGLAWAFIYPEVRFNVKDDRPFYPDGELLHIKQLLAYTDGDTKGVLVNPKGIFTTPEPE